MPVCSQTANYLYITASANAKDKSFHLKDLRKLTFTEEAMTIHVFGTSKTETLPYSNISKLTYTDTGRTFQVERINIFYIVPGISCFYKRQQIYC